MNSRIQTQESEILSKLKVQYESRGYRFLIEPDRTHVPEFLGNFRPDAIAIGENEKVIVEVKSSPQSASDSRAVRFLAEEVPKHIGWRFELVLPESISQVPDSNAEPDSSTLDQDIVRLRRYVAAGEYKVALLVGWGLLEAITRKLALNERFGEPKRFLPSSIVEALVSDGYLDDAEGDRLRSIAADRNRLAHGFTRIDIGAVDVAFLLSIIEKLLAEVE